MPRAKQVPVSPLYTALAVYARSEGETNDCAVKAIAAVTGHHYHEVRDRLAAHGRKNRHGTHRFMTFAVLEELGYRAIQVGQEKFLAACPARWNARYVTTHHPDRVPAGWKDGKTYLLFTRDHVLAVVNGVTHDYSRNRSMRVRSIFEITRSAP